MKSSNDFYDKLSSVYHLIFENWDATIKYQGQVLAKLLNSPADTGIILDCACGIGTQTLALAEMGYKVEGSDLSLAAIERAKKEAILRGLSTIKFRIDDMRYLAKAPTKSYAAVIAMDNSLPHLQSDEEIVMALSAMRGRLGEQGTLLISTRDYDKLIIERPKFTEPRFYNDGPFRRIVHQIWDWQDERHYILHLYITYQSENGWQSYHFTGQYRAVLSDELRTFAAEVGFENIRVLQPEDSGYYQPIMIATSAG